MQETKQKYHTIRSYQKYLLIFIVYFFLLIGNCFAQPVTWQKIYNGPYPNISDYGYDICSADSGNFFVVGSVFNQQIYVLKVNSLGDTIWSKLIGTNYSVAWSVVESDSGSCVLTGQTQNLEAFTIKLDRNGNIVWHKHYGGNYVQLNQIIRTDDNGFIMCGRENFDYGVIVRVDSLGNLIWKRNYYSTYLKNFQSITRAGFSKFILTGWRADTPQEQAKGIVTVIDSIGNEIFDTTFRVIGVTGGRKIIDFENGYIIGGETEGIRKTFLIRLDSNGRAVYTHLFDTAYHEFDFADLKKINNNKFIIATSRDTTNNLINGKVMIIDSLGNTIRQKTFTSSKQVTFGGILVLGDTGFVLAGMIDNNAPTDRDIYVIKIDTLLNAPPPNGIEVVSSNVPDIFLLKNYPNPFNPVTSIEFGIPNKSDIRINIFDLIGKKVESISMYGLNPGIYGFEWNAGKYSSGIYFAVLSVNNKIFKTLKLILLK